MLQLLSQFQFLIELGPQKERLPFRYVESIQLGRPMEFYPVEIVQQNS